MTLSDHLDALGVIAKPAPQPKPPAPDRSVRGWMPSYPTEQPPF